MQDLKQKKAKIIIADVYDQVARQVMCEAYKLEMTAVQVISFFFFNEMNPTSLLSELRKRFSRLLGRR